ncbi:hypothetical protein ACHAWC_001309, partial [Mediolabrus comicus]
MKKYSSTAAVILATSSSSSDVRQAEGVVVVAATIARKEHNNIIRSSSSTVPTTVAPVYAGYYCMGCDDYWRRRKNDGNDDDNSLRKHQELVSAAIKKLGTAHRKRFKENSANAALIESNTVDTAVNPLPLRFDVDEISLAAEERSPTLDKNHPPTRQEDNDIYVPTSLQQQPVESTCTTDLTASNTIIADDNDIVISLLKENQLLKERLELLREIELREKIDLLRIGLSNALNEHVLSTSSSSSDTEEESHHILMEQVLINILKSNEHREKQLFYQMSITIFLVGSLLVAVIYIHNKQRNDTKEEQLVTTEGLTDLLIPSMCPTSPTESLGSITEEGVGVLGNQLSLREENKMLRNQLDLMRAIGGPTNGVIHEDQECDGSVLSDASISVDYSNRMRWWRFGIRSQLLQQQQQQRSIVKGLDRVKADEAAKDVSLSNQHDNAAVDTNDQDSVSQPPQPRWGWGRRKIDEDVVSSKRSRANDDKSNDDDRSQVSLSSMGIAASIDYQLKKM